MSNPFVFDGVALPGDRTAWLAGGLDPDGVVRSFSMEQTGSLIVNGMTTTESLTTSGGLITPATRALNVDGDGLPVDSGYGIWPAATNLVTNGGFETTTTGWDALTGSVARTTAGSKFGAAAGAWTCGGASDLLNPFNVAAHVIGGDTTGRPFTFSAWVKGEGAAIGQTVRLVIRESGGAQPTGTPAIQNFTLTGDWQRVALSGSVVQADRTSVRGDFVPGNTGTPLATGNVALLDGVQFETGLIATPYIETDGSTESRTAGRVQMPVAGLFTATQGAVAIRTRDGFTTGSSDPLVGPFGWIDSGNERIVLDQSPSTGVLSLTRRTGGVGAGASAAGPAYSEGNTRTLVGAWTATQVFCSQNGSALGTASNSSIPALSATTADVGSWTGFSARWLNGNALWAATFAGTLTDDDAAALNALGDTPPTWAQLVSSVAICAMPTALWRAEDGTFIKASYAPDGGS